MPDFTRGVVSNTTTVFMQITLHCSDGNTHRCAILCSGNASDALPRQFEKLSETNFSQVVLEKHTYHDVKATTLEEVLQ